MSEHGRKKTRGIKRGAREKQEGMSEHGRRKQEGRARPRRKEQERLKGAIGEKQCRRSYTVTRPDAAFRPLTGWCQSQSGDGNLLSMAHAGVLHSSIPKDNSGIFW